MREMAKEIGVPYRKLIWSSFYLESAKVNELENSPWFRAEMMWRLKKVDLSLAEANQLWAIAGPLLAERLDANAEALKASIEKAEKLSVLQGRLV